jgi:small subunit ribosomal protein S8
MAKHADLHIRNSNINREIVRVMKSEGYIEEYSVAKIPESKSNHEVITLVLKYDAGKNPVIHEIKKISKPGRRVYAKYRNIERIRNGFGSHISSRSSAYPTSIYSSCRKFRGALCFNNH